MDKKSQHYQNKKYFTISLVILEIIIIPVYAVFLKVKVHNQTENIAENYPSFMDLIILMTLATGYLGGIIHNNQYMGITHNWLYYVICIQICFLFQAFWKRILLGGQTYDHNNTNESEWIIQITQRDYVIAALSCPVMNMVFATVFGRIGFFQKFVIVIIEMIIFTLNAVILNDFMKIYDIGGSIVGNAFGAYFGIGVSYILGKKSRPDRKFTIDYNSLLFSCIGSMLIFCFSPSINAQNFTKTPFEKSIVVMNTILSMCTSIIAVIATVIILRKKFQPVMIFHGCLCGCVGAGSAVGLFVNPCACMILGAVSGVVCILGMQYLSGWLEKKFGIYDNYGVHNIRGIPGIIGGLAGALAIAISYTIPQDNLKQITFLTNHQGRSIGQMAGYQVLGTFSTVFIAILGGMFTGWVITLFYKTEVKDFFSDNIYFNIPQDCIQKQQKNKPINLKKKKLMMGKQMVELNSQFKSVLSEMSISEMTHYENNAHKQENNRLSPATKLQPLKKRLSFRQRIEQTVQTLNHLTVKEEDVEQSEVDNEIKKKRDEFEALEDPKSNRNEDSALEDEQDQDLPYFGFSDNPEFSKNDLLK